MISTGVSVSLLVWIAAFVLTVESMGIGMVETGAMGIESSDGDAAGAGSFQTIDRGQSSGITEALTAVYRTQDDFESFWKTHGSGGGHPPNAPFVDFTTHTVAAVFMGQQMTGGFAIGVTSVEQKEDGGLVVNFTTNAPSPGGMTAQVLTQPYHVVSVGITDRDVTFEGSQATKATANKARIPSIIVGFEKNADFAATVAQIKEDPRVKTVQELKSLKMLFVNFDSEKTNKNEAMEFLRGFKGVTNVEEDH